MPDRDPEIAAARRSLKKILKRLAAMHTRSLLRHKDLISLQNQFEVEVRTGLVTEFSEAVQREQFRRYNFENKAIRNVIRRQRKKVLFQLKRLDEL